MPLIFRPIQTEVRKGILLNCDSFPLNWTSSPAVHCKDTRSSLQGTLSVSQTKLHGFPQFSNSDIFLQISRKYASVSNEYYVLDQWEAFSHGCMIVISFHCQIQIWVKKKRKKKETKKACICDISHLATKVRRCLSQIWIKKENFKSTNTSSHPFLNQMDTFGN